MFTNLLWRRFVFYLCSLGLGRAAVHLDISGAGAVEYYGSLSASGDGLPLTPRRVALSGSESDRSEFAAYVRRGVPVIITGGLAGTGFDVQRRPEDWTCQAIASRFPAGRMKMEYAAQGGSEENPVRLKDVDRWSKTVANSGAVDAEAPKYAPFYWGVKGADEGERLWDGSKDLLRELRKLMRPLPGFLRPTDENMREVLGSPEFWFAGLGAGAKAHMDSHCESTLTLQLAGTKKWRLSWPPVIANGTFAREGALGDGQPYKAKGGWSPTHSFTLEPGEVLLIPPAFVHESQNVGPEDCAPSLTFQFADPAAAGFFRHFNPRLRRLGDFNECWQRVAAMATLDAQGRGVSNQLKFLGVSSLGKLAKLDSRLGLESPLANAILEMAQGAWPQVLNIADLDRDGRVLQADVSGQFWLQGSIDFHDLNEDGEVSQDEFISAFASWLMTEVLVMQEGKQRPKPLKHIEF